MAGSWSGGNSTSTTLPSTCVTIPLVRVAAVAIVVVLLRTLEIARSGYDFQNLRSDSRLAGFVIGQRQVRLQLGRVIGRVTHRHHLRRIEAGHCLQERLIDQSFDIA